MMSTVTWHHSFFNHHQNRNRKDHVGSHMPVPNLPAHKYLETETQMCVCESTPWFPFYPDSSPGRLQHAAMKLSSCPPPLGSPLTTPAACNLCIRSFTVQ